MILSREISFENPPARTTNRGNGAPVLVWREVAAELTRRPGEWARVAVLDCALAAGQYAVRVRNGSIEALAPFGQFDAVTRTVRGERRLYVRFLGGEDL
ncbi:hypothetical protein ACIBQX_11770 [Nonomuraea sp. NPDC049714]|uniref:hypothetical protein n=1 Tax=Nonomuraea sp. NPDC049714 TaxID=3364357 RepID=UPI00379E850C